MVSQDSVREQLKRVDFKQHGWGRAEINELPHILVDGEEIFECVNGIYEGGFALLVATDVRLLLVDKKPFNYLTVEDLRFDMINEIDYNHRLFGAYISISTGSKNLKFRSYNQPRLRKLIGHVQQCMAESKKKQSDHQEGQNQHLEQINQQLQAYLMAQYQHQEELQRHLTGSQSQQSGISSASPLPPEPKPSQELSDYLFAQSLLAQHQAQTEKQPASNPVVPPPEFEQLQAARQAIEPTMSLRDEGLQEVYGKRQQRLATGPSTAATTDTSDSLSEINPLRIAYSKLPMVLRSRKFGRPSLLRVSRVSSKPAAGKPVQPSVSGA